MTLDEAHLILNVKRGEDISAILKVAPAHTVIVSSLLLKLCLLPELRTFI